MIFMSEDFEKYAIWKNGTVVGLKEGATKKAKDGFDFFKQMEKEQEREIKKAEKAGRFAKRIL